MYLFLQSVITVLTAPWVFFKFTTSKYIQLLINTMKAIGKFTKLKQSHAISVTHYDAILCAIIIIQLLGL